MEKQDGVLKRFNRWIDQVILELAKPLMLVMFVMGTSDVLTQGWLADQWWFAYGWAIIQAVTIDGLFFAVWFRLFDAKWSRSNWRTLTVLALIGIVLSLVVMSTNAILSFQQLWGVSTSQEAMVKLGIDPRLFTFIRSVLVVIVTIMVAFVYHRSMVTGEQVNTSRKQAGEQVSDPSTIKVSPTFDERKLRVVNMIRQGANNLRKLANETGISYSTIRRWKKEVDEQTPIPFPTQEATD